LNFGAHSSLRTFLTIIICIHYCACACKPFFECHVWILKHWILKILQQGWRKFLHSNVVNIKAVADFRW
jgi:hypothetical protein